MVIFSIAYGLTLASLRTILWYVYLLEELRLFA